jgi:hypothetical protein
VFEPQDVVNAESAGSHFRPCFFFAHTKNKASRIETLLKEPQKNLSRPFKDRSNGAKTGRKKMVGPAGLEYLI